MESLYNYLTEQARVCREKSAALAADDRADEAVFEKIRGNVFDIFRSVLTAAGKQPDPAGFFRDNLRRISAEWEASLALARAHGDERKAHIESVKLTAAREIGAWLSGEVRP